MLPANTVGVGERARWLRYVFVLCGPSALQAAVPAVVATASLLVALGHQRQAHLPLAETQQEGSETGTGRTSPLVVFSVQHLLPVTQGCLSASLHARRHVLFP